MNYCPKCGHKLIQAKIDGRERLKCTSETCDFVYWENPTPVVAAIVELDERVILTRKKEWPGKMFGLVAGFLEKGETPEDSILREVKEEVGLEGKIVDFVGYYSFFERNQVIFVYHIQAQGEVAIGEELEEVKLISPDKLRPWSIGTGPAVRDWLKNRQKLTKATLEAG